MSDVGLTASGKFEYRPTGLVVHGVPSKAEWLKAYEALVNVGQQLDAIQDQWRWAAGDMLLYGERRFGEEYAQATGYKPQTVSNIMTVCRQIAPHCRRADVPFWTHYECIGLSPEAQQALLARAANEQLTKLEVRQEQRLLRGVEPPKVFTARGKRAYKDVRGTDNIIVVPYWPDTAFGELPKGEFEVTIKEM